MIGLSSTLAGIVTFNPCTSILSSLLRQLCCDECDVVVFDNGSENLTDILDLTQDFPSCRVVKSTRNLGISGAGNEIFKLAIRENKKFVILFDQDSIPESRYCADLVRIFGQYENERVAAIGGMQICRFTMRAQPFLQFSRWRIRKIDPTKILGELKVDFLITSGTLVSVESLREIGGFEDELFIDNVDVEWCFRALAKKYELLGVADTQFSHTIGEGRARFAGFNIAKKHSNFRTYYIWRNVLTLLKRDYVPVIWKINASMRIFVKMGFVLLSSSEGLKHMSAAIRGVRASLPVKTLQSVGKDSLSLGNIRV